MKITYRRRILHVAESATVLEFLARPTDVEELSVLAERLPDSLVVHALGEVRHVKRRLPCEMHCDLDAIDTFLVLGKRRWNTA